MIIPLIINKIASLTPLHILGRLSADLRYLIEISLKNNEKFSVTSLDSNIQLITYKIDSPNKHISKIIIYLHGGGFVIRDSADLIITERLLPLLARKTSNNIIVVSILYPLAPSTSEFHDSLAINSILTSISKVEKLGSIEAIVGDSAGGYLAVQVAEKIKTKKLCLISPWLDLYSYSDSYSRNKQKDFLDPVFLERCRASYLGLERDLYLQLSIASDRCIKYLKESNIKVVAFDMDQCIVAKHSRGCIQRTGGSLSDFVKKVTPSFAIFANKLHNNGIRMAIATHSDAAEYNDIYRHPRDYIIGEELVSKVLEYSVREIVDSFFIVAYNPRARKNFKLEDANKKYHIREIAKHYDVNTNQIILFDDDPKNVEDNQNGKLFTAIKVDPKEGFNIIRIVKNLKFNSENRIDPTENKNLNYDFFNPIFMTNDRLKNLPKSILLIAGTNELFYDDIVKFKNLLETTKKDSFIEIHEAKDFHVYPLFWQHPIRRLISITLIPIILIFKYILSSQYFSKFFESDNFRHLKHKFEMRFKMNSSEPVIDCIDADIGIKRMADFILSNNDESIQQKVD